MTSSMDMALLKMLTAGNTLATSLTNSSMVKGQSNIQMATLIQVGSIRIRSMAKGSSPTQTEPLRRESSKMDNTKVDESAFRKSNPNEEKSR